MKILTAAVCVLAFALSASRALAADRPPNIVLIFTDDQGYEDVGCFGSPDIRTPNLDKMATDGMKFTDFYVAAPVCSASRAALLTGSYCQRVSVTGVLFPKHRTGLNPAEITIADLLKQRGYATACFGKWHLGHRPKFLPTRQGFDTYFGVPYSNDMTIDPEAPLADDILLRQGATIEQIRNEKPKRNQVPLMRDELVVEYPADQTTLTKRYTEEAVKFITAHRDEPFFIYMPHTMPHIPIFASEAFKGGNTKRGLYGDVIEELDWSVGQIQATLRKLGLEKNTLVFFTSDNGPWLSMRERGGRALPLRDGKFTTYEGGMRVPCLATWPGRIPAGTICDKVAATIDLLPTFAELAGCDVPSDRVIDGRSMVPLLENQPGATSTHPTYFFRDRSVREGDWKFHLRGKKPRGKKPRGKDNPPKTKPGPELYNLAEDIGEQHNLAAEHPEMVARLTALILEHTKELKENRRPVGTLDDAESVSK